jgi:uncharacterized protein
LQEPTTMPTDNTQDHELALRVLLITGEGNTKPDSAYRDWIHTFYPSVLAEILGQDTKVTVSSETAAITPDGLAETDVVINNSLFHEPERNEFEALFGFVERGGGFFCLHAGLVSFLNDPRYTAMLGGRFIGHDPIGAFQVEARDNWYGWASEGCPVHPVAQGLTTFGVLDELYVAQMTAPDVEVIARARFNPVMWTRDHGQGRAVTLTLGHDGQAMAHPAFRHLLHRGVRFAARRPLADDSPYRLR